MVLMKRYVKYLLISFAMLFVLTLPSLTISAKSDDGVQRVFDYGDIYTDKEEALLEDIAYDYNQEKGCNFLVVTTNTREEFNHPSSYDAQTDLEYYSDAFYDDLVSTGNYSYDNAVVLSISVTTEGRNADISGKGKMATQIDNSRCDYIFECMFDDLHNNHFFDATKIFYSITNYLTKLKAGINPDSLWLRVWFQVALSFGVGFIIILIMAFNSGGTMTVNEQTYMRQSSLTSKHDHYIRTSISRHKRSTDSSSSSSGGGGGGGGGSSHGGGSF